MERQQFEHIIQQLQGQLLDIGRRFFGNESDARDALQESLLRLWVVRGRLQSEGDVKALGVRIMKNECVNLHRRRHPHSTTESPPPAMDNSPNPHERMERYEEQELLRWAMDNLTEQSRMLLQLHLYEGMSLDEISDATGKTKGSVKVMITRAKQRIIQWLNKKT